MSTPRVVLFLISMCVLVSTLLLVTDSSHGDVIWRKNGRKIEGTILREEKDRILVRIKVGSIESEHWIPLKEIDYIERGELASDEFDRRYKELDPADLAGHEKLMEFARSKRLSNQQRMIMNKLPEVKRLKRIKEHPKKWCRGCDSFGETSCEPCKGTGETVDTCQRCKGEKVIRCRTCGHLREKGKLRCRKCVGKGEYERFDPAKGAKVKTKCTACKGDGRHVCKTCNGKAEQECPSCKGEGGVNKKCTRCQGEPKEVCAKCGGTGLQRIGLTDEEYAKEQEEKAKKEKEAAEAEGEEKPGPTSESTGETSKK